MIQRDRPREISKTKCNTVLCRNYNIFHDLKSRPREISKTKWNTVLCRNYNIFHDHDKEIVQEKYQRQNGIQYCVGIIISFMIQRDRPREISKTKWNTVLCRNYNIFHDLNRSSKRNIKDKMEYSIV